VTGSVHPTPAPEDPLKPDSPGDLTTRSKKYVGRKVVREFMDDQCLELAAAQGDAERGARDE
jgi:membrane protein